ncbi:hypothetical protein GWI33_003170 [Rhynchophorus ferrugineus]|uniref:Ig-like domain-containing protein n=1 Tax=Rhynchophorus ferrugineus TaxID=354439 RepID=A0A834MK38_RHYFE|nr:hypothetical protein GWI33_003170 [Rhynchophorus ferrugineus]
MLLRCIIIWIILYQILTVHSGFFTSSLDKIKKKAQAAYGKKQKGEALNLYGHPKNEYPYFNNKYRDENRAQWQTYYDCLRDQSEHIGPQKTVVPEAILGFEGSFIKMNCKICLSPSERGTIESVVWEWAHEEATVLSPIVPSEHILVSPEDKILQIYNLGSENTGQYVCRLGQTFAAPYFLTVVNMDDSSIREVHNTEAPVGPYPKEPESLTNNLVVDTEWGDWSSCSKCDGIGRKYKLGYCVVIWKDLKGNKVDYEGKNRTKRDVSDHDQLFKIFKYGIPCQSHIIPSHLKSSLTINSRKNEIMSGYCNIKCPQVKIFEVRDKHGKIVEKANNSAGIFSLLQGLPPIEPLVDRRVQYEEKDADIVLICPGNLNSDVPIQWQIGDKNLIPEIISKESNGRIYISITDRVHINKARLADSNIYSCWQGNLAGTIRLVVEKKFKMNFNHTVMLIGIIAIMGTFLYVFIKIIAQHQNMKD